MIYKFKYFEETNWNSEYYTTHTNYYRKKFDNINDLKEYITNLLKRYNNEEVGTSCFFLYSIKIENKYLPINNLYYKTIINSL